MQARQRPPGRGSSVTAAPVKPCGPSQLARWSGRVHAVNTSSRGASNTRVMVRSGIAGQGPQVLLEAVEAAVPEPAVGPDPVGDVRQGFRLQPAGPPLAG